MQPSLSAYSRLTYRVVRPSFLEGVARLFDLAGTLRARQRQASPDELDGDAIASDWLATGDDLRTVLHDYGQRNPRPGRT